MSTDRTGAPTGPGNTFPPSAAFAAEVRPSPPAHRHPDAGNIVWPCPAEVVFPPTRQATCQVGSHLYDRPKSIAVCLRAYDAFLVQSITQFDVRWVSSASPSEFEVIERSGPYWVAVPSPRHVFHPDVAKAHRIRYHQPVTFEAGFSQFSLSSYALGDFISALRARNPSQKSC